MSVNRNAALADLMLRAYQAQTSENLDEAERLYRAALALSPNTFDALHMLGVIRLQKGDAEEATRLLLSALLLLPADYPPIYRNLGLCLGAVAKRRNLIGVTAPDEQGRAYEHFFRGNNLPALPEAHPLVSVVMPCLDEAEFAEAAISSVAEQTYQDVELIVVDGGLQQDRVEAIKRQLGGTALPKRLVKARTDGVHGALNDGIELAQGKYVGIIDCDGLYCGDRVEKFVRMLDGCPARWGFSNVAFVDGQANPVRYGEAPIVDAVMRDFDALYACHAVSASVPDHDYPLTAGNLFFEKTLWQQAGGFPAYRYCSAWAFCLSAILHAEPAYLDEPAYLLRVPASSGWADSSGARAQERGQIAATLEQQTASLEGAFNSTLVRALKHQRRDHEFSMMTGGLGHQIDRTRMLSYAADLGFKTALPG